jgi:hypothetical protein
MKLALSWFVAFHIRESGLGPEPNAPKLEGGGKADNIWIVGPVDTHTDVYIYSVYIYIMYIYIYT